MSHRSFLSHRSLNERREKNGIREEMFTNFEFKKDLFKTDFKCEAKGCPLQKILWKLVVLCDLFPIMWLLPFHTHEKCCFVPQTHINKLFSSLSFVGQKPDTFHTVNRKKTKLFYTHILSAHIVLTISWELKTNFWEAIRKHETTKWERKVETI